jgi:hypothetical protein
MRPDRRGHGAAAVGVGRLARGPGGMGRPSATAGAANCTSSGDNDIVLCAMRAGWEVAYFPSLALNHLIPAGRLESNYLARLNRRVQKSWMQVLTLHDANPWPSFGPAPNCENSKPGSLTGRGPTLRRESAGRVPADISTDAHALDATQSGPPARLRPPCGTCSGTSPKESCVIRSPPAAQSNSGATSAALARWRRAAGSLSSKLPAPPRDLPELHFFTGRKFWYQTAFCLHTLQVRADADVAGGVSRRRLPRGIAIGAIAGAFPDRQAPTARRQ